MSWHGDIPVEEHQRKGVSRRFVPANAGQPGAWLKGDGKLRARDLGMSPRNSPADNIAAFNIWRDELGNMQEFQLDRPVSLTLDEDTYLMGGTMHVRQRYARIYGRDSVLDFGDVPVAVGVNFTHFASVNHLEACGLFDIDIRNTTNDGVRIENAPYFKGRRITVRGAGANGINAMSSLSSRFKEITCYSCGNYGVLVQSSMIAKPVGPPEPGRPFDTKLTDLDIQGCGVGGIAAYECQQLVIDDARCQVNGGFTGRGISIEGGLDIVLRDFRTEKHRYDIVVQKVPRIWGAGDPFGRIKIEGAKIGGEVLDAEALFGGPYIPVSLLVTDDVPSLLIPDGHFGRGIQLTSAGTTGYIGKGAVVGVDGIASASPGFVDQRGPAAAIPNVGAAPSAADHNAVLAALRAKGIIAP